MTSISSFELRPHHLLCIRFFIGKGYSRHFVENMTEMIRRLEQENPPVKLTAGGDLLCCCCPHLKNGRCVSHERVHCFDTAVLSLCGLSFGDQLTWKALQASAEKHILKPGKLPLVCGSCQWNAVCRSRFLELYT